MLINEAFDRMLIELNIRGKDICERSGVSQSRLSQFRSGKGGDIGVRSLDSLLAAAQSLNPEARRVFAGHINGELSSIDAMSAFEKGQLIITLVKSMQKDILADSESLKIA